MTQEERKTTYRALCEQGKITDLFMQPWWLDATGPWDVSLGMRNEQVAAALVYAPKKRWFISLLTMPDFTHHIGFWMDKPVGISYHKWLTREKQLIWSVIDHLPGFGFFSMVFDEHSFDNWLPFYWKGFRQELRYTFVLQKSATQDPEEDINNSFKKKLRKAGESLTISTTIADSTFYAMCTETFTRQKKKTPYTYAQFEKMANAIRAHQAGIFFGCYSGDGELLAVASVVWDRQRAYYFLSGETEAGRQQSASLYLCRHAIGIAFEERNVEVFDFCGSVIEPITEIRRQFGAKSVPLMKIYKANSRWLDILFHFRK